MIPVENFNHSKIWSELRIEYTQCISLITIWKIWIYIIRAVKHTLFHCKYMYLCKTMILENFSILFKPKIHTYLRWCDGVRENKSLFTQPLRNCMKYDMINYRFSPSVVSAHLIYYEIYHLSPNDSNVYSNVN